MGNLNSWSSTTMKEAHLSPWTTKLSLAHWLFFCVRLVIACNLRHIKLCVFLPDHSLFCHWTHWFLHPFIQPFILRSVLSWRMGLPKGSVHKVRTSSATSRGPWTHKYDRYGSLLPFSKELCCHWGLGVHRWWICFWGCHSNQRGCIEDHLHMLSNISPNTDRFKVHLSVMYCYT